MKSNTTYRYGPYYLDRSQSVLAERVDFTVDNGNVSGDRIRPNPITFTKLVQGGYATGETRRFYQNGLGWVTRSNVGLQSDALGIGSAWSEATFTALEDDCWSDIFKQLRGQNQLVVDLVESKQTFRMLRDMLRLRAQMRSFLVQFLIGRGPGKRVKGNNPNARLDYLSNKWLEYRYGWTPLTYSIYDALDTMSKRHLSRVVTVRARKKKREVATTAGSEAQGSPPIIREWQQTRHLSHRSHVSAEFRLPEGQQVSDWTSLNPALIAWELLPMSFVLDWFVNVGQVLENFENWWLFKDKFLSGYKTRTFREVKSYTASGSKSYNLGYFETDGGSVPNKGTWYRSQSWHARSTCSYKQRLVYSQLPLQSNLRIEVNLSSKRILDAAFLTRTELTKMIRKIVR